MLHLTFDGDTLDHSGNENHGQAIGATIAAGINGEAMSFDGINDYVEVPDDDSLDMTNDVTLMSWIKPNNANHIGNIIQKIAGSPNNREYRYYINKDTLMAEISADGSNGEYAISNTRAIEENKWQHVVAVKEGNQITFYVNGNHKGSETLNTDTTIFPGDSNVRIGAVNSATEPFSGLIDEIRIFNYAVPVDDIVEIYEEYAQTAP